MKKPDKVAGAEASYLLLMTLFLACLALFPPSAQTAASPAQAELDRIRDAVASGMESKVTAEFADPTYTTYLFQMAARQKGKLAKLKVNVIPAPPGWEGQGAYWAVFHSYLEIELDHDPVYPLIKTGDGLKLGREIPEVDPGDATLTKSVVDVHILPESRSAHVVASLTLAGGGSRASVFRLNDIYGVESATIDGGNARVVTAGDKVPDVKPGDLVWAGGLLIPWKTDKIGNLTVVYGGVVDQENDDSVHPKAAYLTSWWVPTLAQLPHLSAVRIVGPTTWEMRSEGKPIDAASPEFGGSAAVGPNEKVVAYSCDFPISFPKAIGGLYTLAAEGSANGKAIREYQLQPVQADRAKADIKRMSEALKVYEQYLGPFPFDSYECFDSDTYYGIESYSYTLLQRNITSWACSHEMGHTYFGGLAPCAYVRDSWNEGMTQYMDSVVFGKNGDSSLQAGLATMKVSVPLTKMNVCWDYGSASYFRGAYVMKMLESEIGFQNVMDGLKDMIADRRGKDTAWDDLRPYFEKRSGQNLDWYWTQWIDSAVFPSLDIVEAKTEQSGDGYLTRVTVHQSGSPDPMHLRFKVVLRHGGDVAEQVVPTHVRDETFDIKSAFKPTAASLDLFGYTLGTGGKEVVVGK